MVKKEKPRKSTNPFSKPPKKKKKQGDGVQRPNATALALRTFKAKSPTTKPTPCKPSINKFEKDNWAPAFVTVSSQIRRNNIVDVLVKNPAFATKVVIDVFDDAPQVRENVQAHLKRKEQLIEKYSQFAEPKKDDNNFDAEDWGDYEVDEDAVDFVPPKPKPKPKPKLQANPKKQVQNEKKHAKFTLELTAKFINENSSRAGVHAGHEKLALSNQNHSKFEKILIAKFLNVGEHALPLMNDPYFDAARRDEICLATAGLKWSTLLGYQNTFYLRCISKKEYKEVMKGIGEEPTKTKKKGAHYGKIRQSIVQELSRNGRKETKLEAFFHKLFPQFKEKSQYNHGV